MPFHFILSFFFLLPSQARGLDFGSYPAEVSSPTCKPPNYASFSRARQAEEMIKRNNKDLTKPNFGGHYLLLEVPYMMGSDWLIMDCNTGTFIKEVLNGRAEFKPESFLLRLSDKTKSEWKLWTGSTFVQVEDSVKTGGNPTDPSLQTRYAGIMTENPISIYTQTCAPLKHSSYFRAQSADSELRRTAEKYKKANFAGPFILIRIELVFETIWLIASCETGLFFPEFLSGELYFLPNSPIAVLTRTGKAPELYAWHSKRWIRRPDPTVNDGPWIQNDIHGNDARSLARLFPNPEHRSKIEFQDLICRSKPSWECSYQAPQNRVPLNGPLPESLMQLLKLLGASQGSSPEASFRIDRGNCTPEKSVCSLEVK